MTHFGEHNYIIGKALAYAIAAIDDISEAQRLDGQEREQREMKALLASMVTDDRALEYLMTNVRLQLNKGKAA